MPFFNFLLYIHIICGGLSLLLGTLILATTKGNPTHKLVGRGYYYLMLTSAVVSLPMAYFHNSHFLFVIGVFTSYMLISGKRSLELGRLGEPKKRDWLVTFTMASACFYFVGFGTYMVMNKSNFGFVSLVFGLVGFIFVKQDFTNYRGKSAIHNFGLITHLQRMIGSYIASLTAFVVVNNNFLPQLLGWLLPSMVLVPLIIVWSRRYKRRDRHI